MDPDILVMDSNLLKHLVERGIVLDRPNYLKVMEVKRSFLDPAYTFLEKVLTQSVSSLRERLELKAEKFARKKHIQGMTLAVLQESPKEIRARVTLHYLPADAWLDVINYYKENSSN